jgi:hypothetical protein
MKQRNRIIFEAKGLEDRLLKLAVEPNQPLASIVRAVIVFGLSILEEKDYFNRLNFIILTGAIALLEIEVRNGKPVTLLLLEFRPGTGESFQHLQVEVPGVLGSSIYHNYRVGDAIIVKAQLLNTGESPPIAIAHQIIPFKTIGFINLLKEI